MPDEADVEYIDWTPPAKKTPAKPKAKTAGGTPRVSRGTQAQKDTSGFFGKVLVIATAIFAWSAIKRRGIPDAGGELADELAMDADEAAPIARVLARLTLSNATAAKAIKPFVDNEDFIDAGFALYEYNKRINLRLNEFSRHVVTEVPANVPVRQNPRGQGPSDGRGMGEGSEGDEPIADFDYSDQRGYGAVI